MHGTAAERLMGFFLSEFGFVIGVLLVLCVGALVVEVVLLVQDSQARRRHPRRMRGGRR